MSNDKECTEYTEETDFRELVDELPPVELGLPMPKVKPPKDLATKDLQLFDNQEGQASPG
ncbi:MAG: hypothetical protein AB1646_08330 [Thermodesulfobacteriota bacterium]